jgi:hypothetical protein
MTMPTESRSVKPEVLTANLHAQTNYKERSRDPTVCQQHKLGGWLSTKYILETLKRIPKRKTAAGGLFQGQSSLCLIPVTYEG